LRNVPTIAWYQDKYTLLSPFALSNRINGLRKHFPTAPVFLSNL
jgi:hypothetical protein